MEILLAKGLGNIRFGQTENEIISQLGEPDNTVTFDTMTRLQFSELQVAFSFDEDVDNRLGWIEVRNPEATLFGHKLFGESQERVLSVVSSQITGEPEVEEEEPYESCIYESHEVEFQFTFGMLQQINFGVLWLDDDTPDWP